MRPVQKHGVLCLSGIFAAAVFTARGHAAAPRLILKAPHPSPLSSYRGFFGSRPFSKINAFLQENGEAPLDWSL